MAKLNELKPADFDNLDRPELRVAAGALFDHYAKTARAIEGAALRPDLMNALALVRDQGLAGLRISSRSNPYHHHALRGCTNGELLGILPQQRPATAR
jgi:hypothetical protein